jgi:hypothetical protein
VDKVDLQQVVYPPGLRLRLDREQLEALGILEAPSAGTTWRLEATAIVTCAVTADPDADGDVDAMALELQLVELGIEQAAKPASGALQDRAAALLYRKRAKKAWAAIKIGERDIGGSPDKGEFGVLNRRLGA